MNSSRLRLALVAVAALLVLSGVVLWSQRSTEVAPPVAAAAPPSTAGTSASTTTTTAAAGPTTLAPFTSVVATATVPELEVFASKPADPSNPAAGGVTATTAAPAPSNVQAIPRVGLNSVGTRKTDTGWAFSNPTTFGSPLVVAVHEVDGDWLRVAIAARPNGQEGWIRASDVTLSESPYRMELTLSDFTLRVFQGEEVVVETPVVIGTNATKTPIGTFYLGEVLSAQQAGVGGPNGAYGPFILATSAYSESLDLFDGGLPVIAFHGTNNPGIVGTQSSNGCVRMPNEVITQLAGMLPAGTVITIAP